MLINTLSHISGKLNIPTLLFKVGLLTLINMDSFMYLCTSQASPAEGAFPQSVVFQAGIPQASPAEGTLT